MSADNGIYLLQSKDGFRVVEAQAIGNLYWWAEFGCACVNSEVISATTEEGFNEDVCSHCGSRVDWVERRELNPVMLKLYFGYSPVFQTYSEALTYASKLEVQIRNSMFPILEYGIDILHGWENKEFPK